MSMNKPRIFGGIIVIIGIILNNSSLEFKGIGFVAGAFVGIGFGFIVFGNTIFKKAN